MTTAKEMGTSIVGVANMLHNAISRLAGVCDGATADDGHGFNKFDARWGHEVAMEDPADWDISKCVHVRKRITKYCTQLSRYGIELEEIPEVTPEQARKVLSRGGGWISMRWDFNDPCFDEIRSAVKSAGARWDSRRREWFWAFGGASEARAIAARYGFAISAAAQDAFERGDCSPGDNMVAFSDGGFVLRFGYDPEALSEMRRYWGRCRWDGDSRLWYVDVKDVNAGRIFEFAEHWGLTVSTDAANEARRLMDELAFVREHGAPCDGRGRDDCDADSEVCPSGKMAAQAELPCIEEDPQAKWGSGWTASIAKSFFK